MIVNEICVFLGRRCLLSAGARATHEKRATTAGAKKGGRRERRPRRKKSKKKSREKEGSDCQRCRVVVNVVYRFLIGVVKNPNRTGGGFLDPPSGASFVVFAGPLLGVFLRVAVAASRFSLCASVRPSRRPASFPPGARNADGDRSRSTVARCLSLGKHQSAWTEREEKKGGAAKSRASYERKRWCTRSVRSRWLVHLPDRL